jgi:hypothetical protein
MNLAHSNNTPHHCLLKEIYYCIEAIVLGLNFFDRLSAYAFPKNDLDSGN